MSNIKKSFTRRSDDTMEYDSDDKDSKRKSRNLSEKKRRDQFNLLVNELSSMVSSGGRKMDKSTVLKSTISFLKNHNEITIRSRVNEIQEDWKPTFLTNEEFTHLVLEAVDGFIMVFSTTGQIFYASESITSLLGHLPNEVLSMTIYEMASEEEQTNLYNILLSPSIEEGQVSFSCHLRRGRSDCKVSTCYELIHFLGYFRSDDDMIQAENRYSGYSGEGDTRLVFVGTGRLHKPQLIRELPIVDNTRSEFTSRHSLEWKFLFLDHRAPPIIGYLPFELLGTSGYEYYHVDDMDQIVSCHKALMLKGEGTSCYYRFLTKGQQWIWLQTRFYITYHQWTSKPEFIVCTHRVVSYVDVLKQYLKDNDEPPPFEELTPVAGNGASSVAWSKNTKSSLKHGAPSDCTSMSANSPVSRQSVMTEYSVKSKASHGKVISSSSHNSQMQPQQSQPQQTSIQQHQQNSHHRQPPQQPQLTQLHSQTSPHIQQPHHHAYQPTIHHMQSPHQPLQQPHQSHDPSGHQAQLYQVQPLHEQPHPQQFLEPPQYVAALPMQQVVSSFPSPTVLSPIPPVENVVITSTQTQLQADLQRKHAELQTLIGQQQAELRRVSEQLLMARLGLLPMTPHTAVDAAMHQYATSSATVSSTTVSSMQDMTSAVTGSPIIISSTPPVSLTLLSHQNMMFNVPDSNTQHK